MEILRLTRVLQIPEEGEAVLAVLELVILELVLEEMAVLELLLFDTQILHNAALAALFLQVADIITTHSPAQALT
jgi:hypothetical protein